MKFTAQEEYGLRCLLQIAREPSGFLTIQDIAERESLTTANVAKLMRLLRNKGLVTSTRGQKGGYQLARPADAVNVGEALKSLGGRFEPQDFCTRFAGNQRICVHDIDCTVRALWATIDRAVQDTLGRMTLKELCRHANGTKAWVTPAMHLSADLSGRATSAR